MSQAATGGQLGLLTIPLGMLYEITSHLDFVSALQLAGSSLQLRRALYPRVTSPDTNFPIPVLGRQLLLRHTELTKRQHIRNLACFACMRMLPREAFSASNRRGDRGKGVLLINSQKQALKNSPGPEPERDYWFVPCPFKPKRELKLYWAKRFCWDCGIKLCKFPHMEGVRRYPRNRRSRQDRVQDPADPLNVARVTREHAEEVWYLCHQCGEMKTKKNMCLPVPWAHLEEGESEERKARGHPKMLCSGIFDDHLHEHDYHHQSAVPSAPRSALSRLELLPQKIQHLIFTLLPYKDKIVLSQTSRHFAAAVQPSSSIYYPFSLNEKYAFIRQCEETKGRLKTEHRQDDIACYGCFRMRPLAKFSFHQLRKTLHASGEAFPVHFYHTGFKRWAGTSWSDGLDVARSPSDPFMPLGFQYDRAWTRRCNSCLTKMFYPGLLEEVPVAYRSRAVARNANRRETTFLEDEEAMKRRFLFNLQSLCDKRCCKRVEFKGQVIGREVMRYSDENGSGIKGFGCWGCVNWDYRTAWIERELKRLTPKTRRFDCHGPDDEWEPGDDDSMSDSD